MHSMSMVQTRLRPALPFGAFLAALLLPGPALAQQAVLELDPAQTTVEITLGAFLHTVHGTFKLKRGLIMFDPATGKASGLVVVDAASGDTGNDGRDKDMHQKVLESAKYPEITFAPVQIQGSVAPEGDSQLAVQGVLNLHGQDHEMVIQAKVHIAGGELAAGSSFPIPYGKWGLKNPSTFLLRVKDTVQVNVHAVGRISLPAPNVN